MMKDFDSLEQKLQQRQSLQPDDTLAQRIIASAQEREQKSSQVFWSKGLLVGAVPVFASLVLLAVFSLSVVKMVAYQPMAEIELAQEDGSTVSDAELLEAVFYYPDETLLF